MALNELANGIGLSVTEGVSPDDLSEQYLYSTDTPPTYRYAFARWWESSELASMACWVGLNPATGDTELRRRPTLERMIGWTRKQGLGGLVIVNLFAYRSTDPKVLRTVDDPVGVHNDRVVAEASSQAAITFVAWGADGRLHNRSRQARRWLDSPVCLGLTGSGEPRHPLYVRTDAQIKPWPHSVGEGCDQ